MTPPAILVLAPMPAFPTSAGNRRRLLSTCEALRRGGFAVDLAYFAHEDGIYRRFGHHPPTDDAEAARTFRHVFRIEPKDPVRLTTRATHFGIDDWCPDEVGDFVAWYGARHPETRAILANYVFLSRALLRAPEGVLTLIDTHDRFADRQAQYRPFKAEPNFFYTDAAGEAAGLDRADIVLAIQSEEAAHFASLTRARVHLLPPRFLARRTFTAPTALRRIGFLGHGNDPNLFSIARFAIAWSEDWTPGRPELVIAGEICTRLGADTRPGVRLAGYVDRIEAFYENVDLVVAPMLMGSGLKMKVAEALSFGVPVVGTLLGFEGFSPTLPAHLAPDAEAVKAQVLALADDPAGLATLTQGCARLFDDYNALAAQAEDALLAMLWMHEASSRAGPLSSVVEADARIAGEIRSPPLAPDADPAGSGAMTTALAGGRLTCETSLRSLTREDPDLGCLVATERTPPAGARPYSPVRRRWFATAGMAEQNAEAGFSGTRLALSTEWVRDKHLPAALRADLAAHLATSLPDWEAQALCVGLTGDSLSLVLPLPSHLVTGRHPGVAFLVAPERRELVPEAPVPLNAGSPLAFTTSRANLPAVPGLVTFRGLAGPVGGGTLLFLHDDLIGRITFDDGVRR